MKKRTLTVWACAALSAAVLAGCSNQKTTETSAPAAESTTAAESSAPAETEAPKADLSKMDMVVAGGGGSGLIAAIQAVKEGADPSKVLVIESSGELGANLASMEAVVNAAETEEQYESEIEDSYEQFLADIKSSGSGKNSQELAEFVAESGQEVLDWLVSVGLELDGVEKEEGSSAARSYTASGETALNEALAETLLKQVEELKIQVMKDAQVKEILFDGGEGVSGLKVSGKDGEQTIECISLVIADEALLPLLKDAPVQYTADADGKETGVLVNNCAEVLGGSGESVPGLYAVGAPIHTAVHGEKALAGNEMTTEILFGLTAGTEAGMYASDNQSE